jgi:glycosyltransferase involved in cell wall biosynthesis
MRTFPGGVSVFFPAFNDAGTITQMVMDALSVLPTVTDDYEVIVINDGSADETGPKLEEMAAAHPRLRIIHHSRNLGYGAALRSGFASASRELIFYTDGDGQYDVKELVGLLPLLTEDVDVVNGWKLKRADTWRRVALGGIYQRLARMLFRLPIRDVDCDFRLIRRSALNRIALTSSSGIICLELVRKLHAAGCVFAETPVSHYARRHGRSQFFTLPRVGRTLVDFALLWLKLFVEEPLRRRLSDGWKRKAVNYGTRAGVALLCVADEAAALNFLSGL